MSTATITPKQQNFLRSLLVERAPVLGIDEAGVDALIAEFELDRLTAKSASFAIDHVKKIKVIRSGSSHLPEDAERTIVNRFARPCAICGSDVPSGDGFAVLVNGDWATYHKQGECPAGDVAPARNINDILKDVIDGYFALESTGKNDLVFYRVATNKGLHNPAKKGHRYVQIVIGGQSNDTLSGKRATQVAERLSGLSPAEQYEAQARFGREIGSCGKCGRHLTDEVSRAYGMGATCRGN